MDKHEPSDSANPTDSAGQPWQGRHFEPNEHVNDDGSADPLVISAIELFRSFEPMAPQRAAAQSAVVGAIARSRLLVPLIAEAGDVGVGPNGLVVDKTQELALVTVAGPDGQKVMPAFTSVDAMKAWREDARPVPVEARRAALAAVAEDIAWIVIDPKNATEFVIRRPAVRAIAQGEAWRPNHADPDLHAVFEKGVASDPYVRSIRMVPGDPDARGFGEELILQVVLVPNLPQEDVMSSLNALSTAWAGETVFSERIDSMKIQVIPGA
jgi:hypothetical protein